MGRRETVSSGNDAEQVGVPPAIGEAATETPKVR